MKNLIKCNIDNWVSSSFVFQGAASVPKPISELINIDSEETLTSHLQQSHMRYICVCV